MVTGVQTCALPISEDIGVFIKLPGRREIEQMRVIQSAEFGKAVAMGCQSQESMRTAILDQGGFAYAKADLEELDKILPELNLTRNEYQKVKLEGGDTTELEQKFHALFSQVQVMEGRLLEVYQHSAEKVAERETVLWAVLNLLFWDNGKPVFDGQVDETRKNNYYKAFDEPEKHTAEVAAFELGYLIMEAFLFKGISEDKIPEYAELIREG
jgi:hypothetical protein